MIQSTTLTRFGPPSLLSGGPEAADGAAWSEHLQQETRGQNAARFLLPAVFFQPWAVRPKPEVYNPRRPQPGRQDGPPSEEKS